ncbi:MAG: hypothetical protein ACRDGS_10840 [Chloroflexota bacterium]
MIGGRRAACIALTMLLGGCTHNVYIVGPNGTTGTAEVTTFGNHSGSITINLGGKAYTGRWVYAPGGGAVGFGTATAYSGGQTATATSTFVGLPTGGPGTILASAADGSTLRCAFTFSEMGRTGIGRCEDDKGEMYDLQID